jgi:hypothetical protein
VLITGVDVGVAIPVAVDTGKGVPALLQAVKTTRIRMQRNIWRAWKIAFIPFTPRNIRRICWRMIPRRWTDFTLIFVA